MKFLTNRKPTIRIGIITTIITFWGAAMANSVQAYCRQS